MSVTESTGVPVPKQFRPKNDPGILGTSEDRESLREPHEASIPLASDSELIGPEELHGCTLDEAENAYIGRRRSEAASHWDRNTLSGTAERKYACFLQFDREIRAETDTPSVAMLTLVGPGTDLIDADAETRPGWLSDGTIPRVDYARAVTEGFDTTIQRLRDRLDDLLGWYAVRDSTVDGFAHWHLIVWIEGDDIRPDLEAGVGSYVDNNPIARGEDHPLGEAVKIDPTPEETIDPSLATDQVFEGDLIADGGQPTHPFPQYCASNLPHLAEPEQGDMTPSEVTHGAIEWATKSRYARRSQ